MSTLTINRPQSRRQLFWAFTWLALQGFGGVMAIAQRELVDKRRWLSPQEFAEEWAVAQVLPGPNVVNLALMFGQRYFGFSGALCALAGMLVLPFFVVLTLAVLLGSLATQTPIASALRGLSAVAAGLIAAAGLKLLPALRHHILPRWGVLLLAGTSFGGLAFGRWPLPYLMLSLGGLAWVWSAHCLRRQSNTASKLSD